MRDPSIQTTAIPLDALPLLEPRASRKLVALDIAFSRVSF